MNVAPLVVRWIAGDAARVRAALAAALGVEVPAGRAIALPGLHLEIAEREPGSRTTERLEVVAADPWSEAGHAVDDAITTGARLLALGWATVDLERAAATWASVHWAAAPRDSLMGARALLGAPAAIATPARDAAPIAPAAIATPARDAAPIAPAAIATPAREAAPTAANSASTAVIRVTSPESGAGTQPPDLTAATITIALLEPDTEGRLAAGLARHGEGPAALYIWLPAMTVARARIRLARVGHLVSVGSGPFGPEMTIAARPASSPTLIFVPATGPDATTGGVPASPVRGRRGTIQP